MYYLNRIVFKKFCTESVFKISTLIFVLLVSIGIASCRLPFDSFQKGPGSLSFNIDSSKSIGTISQEPVSYIFSGTGPDNDLFSMEVNEPSATVDGLNTGEWTVRVDGLDENHSVILTGESTLSIAPSEETQVNIALHPKEGSGSVSFTLAWNAEHTVAPSAVATFINTAGTVTSNPFIIGNPGLGECIVDGLPTGNYYVTVQLFDSGVLSMGSAWTVRVLNGSTLEVSASFDNLNKVGERIEITNDTFTIAWDPDPQSGTPDAYRVYFRNRGEEAWNFLSDAAPDMEPSFLINQDNLSFGIYEFAVSEVVAGVESDLHTSMDDTANPGTGWFVDWHLL